MPLYNKLLIKIVQSLACGNQDIQNEKENQLTSSYHRNAYTTKQTNFIEYLLEIFYEIPLVIQQQYSDCQLEQPCLIYYQLKPNHKTFPTLLPNFHFVLVFTSKLFLGKVSMINKKRKKFEFSPGGDTNIKCYFAFLDELKHVLKLKNVLNFFSTPSPGVNIYFFFFFLLNPSHLRI